MRSSIQVVNEWIFPSPEEADPTGLLAIGADLEPATLLSAYRQGIFPWPSSDYPELILWFSPPKRAILVFDELHIPRSLLRAQKKSTLRFTQNQVFGEVIRACAEVPRAGQPTGTWINPQMVLGYERLHRAGHAHSFEAWEGDTLVAGLYGVEVDGVFAGESMFHRQSNASKILLLRVVEELRGRGAEWLDIQMLTPHLEALGARELERNDFLALLHRSRSRGRHLFQS